MKTLIAAMIILCTCMGAAQAEETVYHFEDATNSYRLLNYVLTTNGLPSAMKMVERDDDLYLHFPNALSGEQAAQLTNIVTSHTDTENLRQMAKPLQTKQFENVFYGWMVNEWSPALTNAGLTVVGTVVEPEDTNMQTVMVQLLQLKYIMEEQEYRDLRSDAISYREGLELLGLVMEDVRYHPEIVE